MLKYISKRVIYAFVMLFVLSIVVYLIFGLVPIDPAQLSCGTHCNTVVVEANRHRLGLDIPLWHQW